MAVRGSGGANLASSSLTLSLSRAISWSLAVGSVVTSGGGALLLLMVVQRCTSQCCGEAVRWLGAATTLAPTAFLRANQAVLGRTSGRGHFLAC